MGIKNCDLTCRSVARITSSWIIDEIFSAVLLCSKSAYLVRSSSSGLLLSSIGIWHLRFQLHMTTGTGEELPKKLQLYSYFMSPPSFSVRIALNLKGLDYEYKAIDLFKREHHSPEFLKINPLGYIPALMDGDVMLSDSFAMILYLEEKYPKHLLLPCDLAKKAINYQVANIVSSSIQPLMRLPILRYIEENVGLEEKFLWINKHVGKGFAALEKLLKYHAEKYATGDEIFLADVFLAPYIIGYPQRYNFDMSEYPLLSRLREAYMLLPAIQDAMPENQPDVPIN